MKILEERTLRHPLNRITVRAAAKRWLDFIGNSIKDEKFEIFTIGFWFLEQIGVHQSKDYGLALIFSIIYSNYPTFVLYSASGVF